MEFRALSEDEQSALADGLALAARLVAGAQPLSVEQVQELYNALLNDHPDFAEGQIAAGLAFGDLIAKEEGYQWVRVSSEHGEETALSFPGVQIACHPISMIQKRIARGEKVDILELKNETIRTVDDRVKAGNYLRR